MLETLELIVAWLARIPILPMIILFSLLGLGIGFFLVKKPNLAIEIQKKFYAQINWRMEPISLQKELRNTRIMGFILIILLLGVLFIYLRNIGFCVK